MSIHKASQILYSRVSQLSYSLSFYAQLRPDSKMQTSRKRRYGEVHVWAPIYLRMTHCQVRRDATRHGPARHHHHRCPCLLPALRSSRLSTASRALRDYGKVNSVENERVSEDSTRTTMPRVGNLYCLKIKCRARRWPSCQGRQGDLKMVVKITSTIRRWKSSGQKTDNRRRGQVCA